MHEDKRQRLRDSVSLWGSSGWRFHNSTVELTYGFKYEEVATRPIRYVMGYGRHDQADQFLKGGEVRIVHWIGTDVMEACATRRLPPAGTVHFADSWDLVAELATIGVEAQAVCHRPRNRVEEPLPLPNEKRVAVYLPPTRRDFFRYSLMLEVERMIRPAGWDMAWLDMTEEELNNGTRDYMGIMRSCSHYLRCPVHDGFSHTSAEYIMAGRTVITTSERPFQVRVKPNVNDILKALEETPYQTAPAFYRHLTDVDRLYEAIWEAAGW